MTKEERGVYTELEWGPSTRYIGGYPRGYRGLRRSGEPFPPEAPED
jgi:hypothetical protein